MAPADAALRRSSSGISARPLAYQVRARSASNSTSAVSLPNSGSVAGSRRAPAEPSPLAGRDGGGRAPADPSPGGGRDGGGRAPAEPSPGAGREKSPRAQPNRAKSSAGR